MALTSARFEGAERLERCLAGDFVARLTPETTGDFVALVQQALMDLGEPLPFAGADGVYGEETTAAVLHYKTRHDIRSADGSIDGIVGPKTMAKLDEECTARDQVPGPCPPEADGPGVDLAGVDELLVNMVLAKTTAAAVIGVDGDSGTRTVPAGVDLPTSLLRRVVEGSAGVLSDASVPFAAAELVVALGALATAHANAGEPARAQSFVDGGQSLASIDAGTALADFLTQALATAVMSAGTPVRDLSKKSALLEAEEHAFLGRITLTPGPQTLADGSVQHPDERGKFRIGPVVAGVTFKVTNFGDKRLPSYQAVNADLRMLDVRHVVGLVRLALFLAANFGVTEVHHCGISGDTTRTDCHGNGRAIDFVGVVGTAADTPYHLTVFNDWKNRSVPNLDDRSKPRRPDWPPVSRRLEYRLKTLPGADSFARRFFADLYAWVASEYQDRSDGPGQIEPPSAIGEGSRIMTPDHPTSKPGTKNGREAHHSHMHWQVGPTGFQAP